MKTLERFRSGRFFWCLPVAFFATEAILGLLLQIASNGEATRLYSYACVVLACLFCATFAARTPSYLFTQLALLLTVGADWFLVMREPREQLPAMLFFSGTQLAYFLRIYFSDGSALRRRVHLILRASVCLAVFLITLLVLGEGADAVALVSTFYYANLLLNIVFAFLVGGVSFFSVGLVLFAMCDTIIGLACIDPYLSIPKDTLLWRMLFPGFDLAWAFYVPSQALLATSLWRDARRSVRVTDEKS